MFVFADSAWQIFSVLSVFLAGLWVSQAQESIFAVKRKRALFLYLWHTAFCLFYFLYTVLIPSDANLYFSSSFVSDLPLEFGTTGIVYLTSLFSQGLGFSYGGVFLVNNIIGFIGLLSFASALDDVLPGLNVRARFPALLLVLLPGLSFWSSAIGKDSLTFMGAGLATWGALALNRRYPSLVIAALAFLLARPHMLGILLSAIAFSLIVSGKKSLPQKILFLSILLPASFASLDFGSRAVGLDDFFSVDAVSDYINDRQEYNLDGGSSVDISVLPIPFRMLTYLYRPLFFDANGLLGLIVSLENLLIFSVTAPALLSFVRGRKTKLPPFAFLFFSTYSAISWFLLANTTANLGIAIRQKLMFLPMLLVLSCAYRFRDSRA